MDPYLTGAIVLIGFAILMVAIAWRRWTNATQSFSRVEALRALVAESSALAGAPVTAPPVTYPPVAYPLAAAPPVADPEEDWDLRLRKQSRDDSRPTSRAGAAGSAARQFVVTVPDTSAASASQLSFQRTDGRT